MLEKVDEWYEDCKEKGTVLLWGISYQIYT